MSQKFLKHLESNISLILKEKDSCISLKQLCAVLGYSEHGRNTKVLKEFLFKNNIDVSHFSNNGRPILSYVTKICPQCFKEFQVKNNTKYSKQITCSHQCSNSYFKQATKSIVTTQQYTVRAKKAGMDKCCICDESNVVDIHHIDSNRNNNDISNLVPLCPTHHAYIHRGKLDLILDKLSQYLDNRNIGVLSSGDDTTL